MMLTPTITTNIMLEYLYKRALSAGHPEYNAYVEVTRPRLPNPDTNAALTALPTSP